MLVVLVAPGQIAQHPPGHLPILVEPADHFLVERAEEVLGDAFAHLQHDVADKTLADEDVRLALVQATAFHVADVVFFEPAVLQESVRFAAKVGAFAVLAPDVDQADARLFDAEDVASVDRPHHRVLVQVFGAGRRVRTDVHEHRAAAQLGSATAMPGRFTPLR